MAVRPTVTDPEGLGKELLAASPDLLGSMVKAFAEALMNAEVDEICNAEYGEVSPERANRRNGYRDRQWDTRAGTIELAIPRLRPVAVLLPTDLLNYRSANNALGLDFSPDGTMLASSWGDLRARLWDTSVRGFVSSPIVTFGDNSHLAEAVLGLGDSGVVTFSPDGRRLLRLSDENAMLWDVDPAGLAATVCADPAGRITPTEWAHYIPQLPFHPPCA